MASIESGSARIGSGRLFWLVFTAGALLRLIPLFFPLPSGDGARRLYLAVEWAFQPQWWGLSGQWPPLLIYIEGLLIRWGLNPIGCAHALNYLFSLITLPIIYYLAMQITPDRLAATCSMLMAATFWTHIAFTSTNLIEPFYILLISAFVLAFVTSESEGKWALADNILLALLMLLLMLTRIEARLIFIGSALYLLVRKSVSHSKIYLVAGCLGMLYIALENYWLRGDVLADARAASENALIVRQLAGIEYSLTDRIAAMRELLFTPSLFAFLMVVAGIGVADRRVRAIIAWLLLPLGLALSYSVLFGPIDPYPRFFVPLIVPLLAFAGGGLAWMARRSRWLAAATLTSALLIQPLYWGYRACRASRPYGWQCFLPVYLPNREQIAVQNLLQGLPQRAVCYVFPGAPTRWTYTAAVLNANRTDLVPTSIYRTLLAYYTTRRVMHSVEPESKLKNIDDLDLNKADYLIIDPSYPYKDWLSARMPPTVRTLFESDFVRLLKVERRANR